VKVLLIVLSILCVVFFVIDIMAEQYWLAGFLVICLFLNIRNLLILK